MNKEGEQREKDMVQHGSKIRAGVIISSLFRSIGTEMTERVLIKVPDSKSGKMEPRFVSKAEAIVRDCYEKALPKKLETIEIDAETGQEVTVVTEADPKMQLEYRKIIFDRIAGKAGADDSGKDAGESVPDRVSRLNKDRLNDIAMDGEKEHGKTSKKTTRKPRIPVRLRSEPEVQGSMPGNAPPQE